MPPMAAPHLTARVMEFEAEKKAQQGKPKQLPWTPISTTISIPREPPNLSAEETERRRQKRNALAANANERYEEWREDGPHEMNHPILMHPNDHRFRDRRKESEHAGEWASADKLLHYRDRIQREVSTAEALYLRHPPYPKSGGGVKNVDFSYMRSGYDYRLREPSKEVAGTWSIMRVRPSTESARINEAAAASRPRDTLGGGRWTNDHKYGNPPAFSPTTTGDNFRQATPHKWLQNARSPPPTAPGARKWRGSFATDFPPRSAVPAQPFVGDMPWLHHTEEYVDHICTTMSQ